MDESLRPVGHVDCDFMNEEFPGHYPIHNPHIQILEKIAFRFPVYLQSLKSEPNLQNIGTYQRYIKFPMRTRSPIQELRGLCEFLWFNYP